MEEHRKYPPTPSVHEAPPADVLLVDDDHMLLEALSGTLQLRLGHFTLDTRDTGMKGLAALSATRYDTIITDVRMPGMSGLECGSRDAAPARHHTIARQVLASLSTSPHRARRLTALPPRWHLHCHRDTYSLPLTRFH